MTYEGQERRKSQPGLGLTRDEHLELLRLGREAKAKDAASWLTRAWLTISKPGLLMSITIMLISGGSVGACRIVQAGERMDAHVKSSEKTDKEVVTTLQTLVTQQAVTTQAQADLTENVRRLTAVVDRLQAERRRQ